MPRQGDHAGWGMLRFHGSEHFFSAFPSDRQFCHTSYELFNRKPAGFRVAKEETTEAGGNLHLGYIKRSNYDEIEFSKIY